MTKADLIKQVAKSSGLEINEVRAIVEHMILALKGALLRNEIVYIRKFGTFKNKKRAKKTGRNISENTPIVIDAHHIPSFKPSKQFSLKIRKNLPVKEQK